MALNSVSRFMFDRPATHRWQRPLHEVLHGHRRKGWLTAPLQQVAVAGDPVSVLLPRQVPPEGRQPIVASLPQHLRLVRQPARVHLREALGPRDGYDGLRLVVADAGITLTRHVLTLHRPDLRRARRAVREGEEPNVTPIVDGRRLVEHARGVDDGVAQVEPRLQGVKIHVDVRNVPLQKLTERL